MKGKYFIDTNIFFYAHDSSDLSKQERSIEIIEDAMKLHCGTISYQVIQEYINVVETKLNQKAIKDRLSYFLNNCMYPLCSVFVDFDLYDEAIVFHRKHRFSFYDSLIVCAAKQADCKFVYTEDMHACKIRSYPEIVNPFQ